MEHEFLYDKNMNIIDIIDTTVGLIASTYWVEDECPPKFLVSLDNEDFENQRILITIDHLGSKFTETLFPKKDTGYGYEPILNQMINMYNRTM